MEEAGAAAFAEGRGGQLACAEGEVEEVGAAVLVGVGGFGSGEGGALGGEGGAAGGRAGAPAEGVAVSGVFQGEEEDEGASLTARRGRPGGFVVVAKGLDRKS